MRHIRDLLKSVDPADAYAGVDCNSVSFLNIVTVGDILGKQISRWEMDLLVMLRRFNFVFCLRTNKPYLRHDTTKLTKWHVSHTKTQLCT